MGYFIGVIMILAMGYSQGVQAHAEHDKARFVANNGADHGNCNNRFRPCKTVTYASQKANKGDTILVAQGEYIIESEQDLLYFTGQIVPVLGGFNQVEQYQGQNPDTYLTTVSGVPGEYAEQLRQQGFHVIRDTKGLTKLSLQGKGLNISQLQLMQKKQANSTCIDGSADGFDCNNMSLLAHIPLSDFPSKPTSANDIWGHVDLNTEKEYAIIGLRNAVAVVDVTTPTSPEVIGSISGLSSTWRDIKVYQYFDTSTLRWQAYAYATTEANEGLSIIDLNDLENGISVVRRQTTDSTAHNIYISNLDYGLNIPLAGQVPAVHILGSNNFAGAFRSYSLSDPETLGSTYTNASSTRNDYTHDATSLTINDARAQTDCVQANNTDCLVILDFNEDNLRVWDHTDKNQAIELGSSSYPNAEYTHSGWWSEDKQYVIVHDELDEQTHGLNTTLNIFDISSLSTPTLVGTWSGPTRAIDHNGFVRGNRYYMSNYERGLTVLDITDPSDPVEVGFFDTYPVSDNAAFNGAWGVYPFLPSGNILVSDINSGLYIIHDQTLENDTGNIAFDPKQRQVDEGQSVSIVVTKTGNGASTVSYEIVPGSAGLEDVMLTTGELQWTTNDTQPQNITLQTNNDALDEITESVFIRLFNPRNGATLVNPSITTVQIIDALQQGQIVFSTDEITVKETDGSVQIAVTRQGGSDGIVNVEYVVSSGSAILGTDANPASGTLEWLDGDNTDQHIEIFLIDDNETEAQESLVLTLTAITSNALGNQSTLHIVIRDDESNQAPIATAGDDSEVNTRQNVTLAGMGSDPEEQPLNYLWQQISGTNVTINNENNPQANFTAPSTAGTLTFSLTITDDFGLASSDNVNVTVIASVQTTDTSSGGGSIDYWLLISLLSIILIGNNIISRPHRIQKI
ncbi:choice-of-anchor B family protein [Paraglaciecola sp. MB-3u-78]|uniref:choice-of-anchor B family protein n=1 Tax=Paraglaciecola sp. MB-3u-78 TaxID=2058332 RepID=UPI001E6061F0|nr:choice-of-anchor B family protein [Paraglaciecola sp. MB-3u-78]